MNKLLNWLFDHFIVTMCVFFIVAFIANLIYVQTVYDGDFRCMVAECRIVKK